jgi:splicing factor U2AF subunit
MTQWDIKPPGYENVTAEQAKLSGMFPLPGAPRQQPMDPSRLQAFINQPANSAAATALKPSSSRQSKRLFVHNIPANTTEDKLVDFFNLQLNGMNVITGIDPCVSALISTDTTFALLEFKSANDATVALALTGITMENNDNMETTNGTMNGDTAGLSIRRPRDYIGPAGEAAEPQEGISNDVKDSPDKICISNIPPHLTDEMVQELLSAFGALKAFVLAKDTSSEESRVSFARIVSSHHPSNRFRVLRFASILTQVLPILQLNR